MDKYDDIINLDHPISKNHRPMSIYDRSAQFAPFAALTGYDESIEEASRIVDNKITLGIDKTNEINEKLTFLASQLINKPQISITYFKKDRLKEGGKYISITGIINKIDTTNRKILINKTEKIDLDDIIDISFSYE